MAAKKTSARGLRSLDEFAKIAGVSAATVSRALADSPLTAEKTRKRIQKLAREVGFSVNPAASMLRTRITRTIGLVIPMAREMAQPLSDPFWTAMLGQLADGVAERKYDLLVKRIQPDDGDWLKPIIESRRVDGILILGQADQDAVINLHADHYAPLVVWGQWTPEQKYLTVGLDNNAGGRIAAEHFLSRGRKRLLYVGDVELPEFAARYRGFLSAIPDTIDRPRTIRPEQHSFEYGYAAAARFLEEGATSDAVFAGSDLLAVGFARGLRERGLRIPEDVALIGFDDVLASQNEPPLTTIRQDLSDGAAMMCERLFARMAGKQCTSVLLPPQLVVRAST